MKAPFVRRIPFVKPALALALGVMAVVWLAKPVIAWAIPKEKEDAEVKKPGAAKNLLGALRQAIPPLPGLTRTAADKPSDDKSVTTGKVKPASYLGSVAQIPDEPSPPTEFPAARGNLSFVFASDPEAVFMIRGNALALQRSRPKDAFLFADVGGNASDYHFDYEPGWEFSAFWNLGDDRSTEVRYFQVIDWSDHIGSLAAGDTAETTYESELRSGELNLRRQVNNWLSLLVGARYVNVEELLSTSLSEVGGDPAAGLTAQVCTINHLFGLQIGADARLWRRGRLSLDGIIKAGIYFNDATTCLNGVFKDADSPPEGELFAGRDNNGHLAFFGETGLTGVYQLTDRIAIRGGYTFIWIEGVALASEQLPNGFESPAPTIPVAVHFDGVFYHGANLGFEIRW